MSWDIFVQDLPAGVQQVADIPDDFVPRPVGDRREIVAGIRDVFPDVDFSDPQWGIVEKPGFSIEINLSCNDPVKSFGLHVRGGGDAVAAVAALLDRLQLRALDPQSSTGIFGPSGSVASFEQWQAFRDHVIEQQRGSSDHNS